MARREARQGPPWTWITIGVGSGLLITLLVGLGIRYYRSRQESDDPRARQVEELLEEAERLLAQGRRAGAGRRGQE